MPEKKCDQCGQVLSFPEHYRDARIRCPQCGREQQAQFATVNAGPVQAAIVPQYQPDRSGLVFVLGILSLLVCPVFGPFAWSMGKNDMAKIDRGIMNPGARGLTQAGMVMGIISTVMLLIGIVFFLLWILLFVGIAFASIAA